MFVEKQKLLKDAMVVLNNDNQPWKVIIEGDSIIAKWKWEDARFFSATGLTESVKNFTFKVTLDDNGKWHEMDIVDEKKTKIDLSSGKMSFENSFFNGKTSRKTITIGVGQNKETGEVGVVKSNFDTSIIKEPIRNYLKKCGWTNSSSILTQQSTINNTSASYCTKCGNLLTNNMKFCNNCGNQISGSNQNLITGNTNLNNNFNQKNSQSKNNTILIVFVVLGALLGSLFLFGLKIDFDFGTTNDIKNEFVGEWYCIYKYQTKYEYNYKIIINKNNTYTYGDPNNIDENNFNGSYTMNYNEDKQYYEFNLEIDNYLENGKPSTPENEEMHYV